VADVLGVLGIIVFIVCVIALAAGVTWVVVRFSPKQGAKKKPAAEPPAA
jgi:flagellar basal body-associated protein FliL